MCLSHTGSPNHCVFVCNPVGQAVSHDPEPTVHSKDVVYVRVVRLTGVRIVIPSNKLVIGEEVGVVSVVT